MESSRCAKSRLYLPLVIALLAAVLVPRLVTVSQLTPDVSLDEVRLEMTRQEVEAALGSPAVSGMEALTLEGPRDVEYLHWGEDSTSFYVRLKHGKVWEVGHGQRLLQDGTTLLQLGDSRRKVWSVLGRPDQVKHWQVRERGILDGTRFFYCLSPGRTLQVQTMAARWYSDPWWPRREETVDWLELTERSR